VCFERGHTVRKTIENLIATFCIRGGHSLLHRYRDFDPFETYLNLSHPRLGTAGKRDRAQASERDP
jgi:predicted nucleic acid-binding protein